MKKQQVMKTMAMVLVTAMVLVALACGGASSETDVLPETELPPTLTPTLSVIIPVDTGSAGAVHPVALTHDAQERSRVRSEQATLIASVPTATPRPTASAEQVASQQLTNVLQGTPVGGGPAGMVPTPTPMGVWWLCCRDELKVHQRIWLGDRTPKEKWLSHPAGAQWRFIATNAEGKWDGKSSGYDAILRHYFYSPRIGHLMLDDAVRVMQAALDEPSPAYREWLRVNLEAILLKNDADRDPYGREETLLVYELISEDEPLLHVMFMVNWEILVPNSMFLGEEHGSYVIGAVVEFTPQRLGDYFDPSPDPDLLFMVPSRLASPVIVELVKDIER